MDFGIKITSVIILLSFYCLSIISGINIDCNGRAFYCVNSTHFKICADLGGGVSKTVDDFLLPCPHNTYCRETNEYECEYYETTTPSTMIAGELSVINDLVEPSVIPLSHTAQMLQVKSYTSEPASLQDHASKHEDLSALDTLVTSTPHVTDNQEINNTKNTNVYTTQLIEKANTQDFKNKSVEANMVQNEVKIKNEDNHWAPKDNALETSTTTIGYVTNLLEKDNLNSFTTENYDISSTTFINESNNTIEIKSELSINKTDEIKTVGSDTIYTMQTTIKQDDIHLFQNTTKEYLPHGDHLKSLTTEHYKIVLKTVITESNNDTNVESNLPKNIIDIMKFGGSDSADSISTTSNYDSIQLLKNITKENVLDDETLNSLTTKNYKNVSESIAEKNTINVKLKLFQNKSDGIEIEKSDFSYIVTTTLKYNKKQLLHNTTQKYFPDNNSTETLVGGSNNTVNVELKHAQSNTDVIKSQETDSVHTMSTISNYDSKQLLQNTTKEYFSDDINLKLLTTEDYKIVSEILIADSNDSINIGSKLKKTNTDIMKPRENDTVHTMPTTSNNGSKKIFKNATKVYLPDDDHLKSSITEEHKNVAVTLISDKNNTINVDLKIPKNLTHVLKSRESETGHTRSISFNNEIKQMSQNSTIGYVLDNDGLNSLTTDNYEIISESNVKSNSTVNIKSKLNESDVIKIAESESSSTSITSQYDDKQLPNTTKEYLSDEDYSLTTKKYGIISETIAGSNNTIHDFQSKPINNTSTTTSEKIYSAYTLSIPSNYDDKKGIRNSTIEYLSEEELLTSLTTENYKNVSESLIADSNNTINVDSNLQANHTNKMESRGSASASEISKLEYDDKQLLQKISQEYLPEPLDSKDNGSIFVEEITSLGNDTLSVLYPIISTTEQIKINYETENIIDEVFSTKSNESSFSLSHSTTESVLVATTNIDLPYSTVLNKTQLNNTKISFDWHNSPLSILGPQTTSDGSNNSYYDYLPLTKNIISTTKSYDENKEKTTILISQLNVDKHNSVSEQMVTNVHAINENNEPSNHYEKVDPSFDKNINVDKNETYIYSRGNNLNLISSSDYSNPYNNVVLEPTIEKYKQEQLINGTPDSQITSKEYIINGDASISSISTSAANIVQSNNEEYLITAVSNNLTTISLSEDNLTGFSSTGTPQENFSYATDFEKHSNNVTPDPIKVGNIPTNKDIHETTTLLISENDPNNVNSEKKYFTPRTTLMTNVKYLQNESTLPKTTPIEATTNRIYISNTIIKASPSTVEANEYLKKNPNNVTKSFLEKTFYNKTFTPKLIEEIPLITVNQNGMYNDSITHSIKYFETTKGDRPITSERSLSTERATVIDVKATSQKLNIEATTLYTFDPVSENSFVYNSDLKSVNNEDEINKVSQNLKNIISNVTSNNAKNPAVLINVQGKSDNKSNLILNGSPARFNSTNQTISSFLELNKIIKANAISTTQGGLIHNKSQDNNNSNDLFNVNNNKIKYIGRENLGATSAPLISLNSTQIKIYNQTQRLLLKILSGEQSDSKVYVNTLISYCQNQPAGKYADKNNCKKFYVCLEVQLIIGECPHGTVFSENKKLCTKNLSHCYRNNQFKCLSPGRYYDLGIQNVYYICVKNKGKFLKFKYQCQSGYSLNKTIIQCIQDSANVSTANSEDLSNTKEESTSISLESSTSETEDNDKEFECKKEGKFPHPKECNKYYLCSKTKKSEFRRRLKRCDSNEVFDKEKHNCVDSDSSSEC